MFTVYEGGVAGDFISLRYNNLNIYKMLSMLYVGNYEINFIFVIIYHRFCNFFSFLFFENKFNF